MAIEDQDAASVTRLATAHGLHIDSQSLRFNEMGLDFRVALVTDSDDQGWILRLPRRADAMERAQEEAKILALLQSHLPVAVPDWRIVAPELIAYPMLPGHPALTFDAATYEVTWHFDKALQHYAESLGAAIAALHAVDADAACAAGMKPSSPDAIRNKWLDDLQEVGKSFDILPERAADWRSWIEDDSYWPDFAVPIHGDLYAGHVMVDEAGRVTGIIDWSEARIGDPAVDLAGHLKAFHAASLKALISAYEAAGGRSWTRLEAHCLKLVSAGAISYGIYALKTGDEQHIKAAQSQMLAPI